MIFVVIDVCHKNLGFPFRCLKFRGWQGKEHLRAEALQHNLIIILELVRKNSLFPPY